MFFQTVLIMSQYTLINSICMQCLVYYIFSPCVYNTILYYVYTRVNTVIEKKMLRNNNNGSFETLSYVYIIVRNIIYGRMELFFPPFLRKPLGIETDFFPTEDSKTFYTFSNQTENKLERPITPLGL